MAARAATRADAPVASDHPFRSARLASSIARRFTDGEEFGQLVDAAAREIAETDRGAATIALLSDDGLWLQTVGFHDSDAGARRRFEAAVLSPQPVDSGALAQLIESREPVLAAKTTPDDVAESLPHFAEYAHAVGVSSYAIVPLRARGNVIGTLTISRSDSERPYTPDDVEALAEIGDVLALGIDSALLVEAARRAGGRRSVRLPGEPAPPVEVDRRDPLGSLTDRERAILDLIADGLTSKQIGEQLKLSARTVEWHRTRIAWKLGATDRAQLVALARGSSG